MLDTFEVMDFELSLWNKRHWKLLHVVTWGWGCLCIRTHPCSYLCKSLNLDQKQPFFFLAKQALEVQTAFASRPRKLVLSSAHQDDLQSATAEKRTSPCSRSVNCWQILAETLEGAQKHQQHSLHPTRSISRQDNCSDFGKVCWGGGKGPPPPPLLWQTFTQA